MTHTTGSQGRDNAKDGKAQKARRRAAWMGLPCGLCGVQMYWGKDRTGRYATDATIGHIFPHSKGGTYAADNTFPCCSACNAATGTRDLTGVVKCGPAWPSLKDAARLLDTLDKACGGRRPVTTGDAADRVFRAEATIRRAKAGHTF